MERCRERCVEESNEAASLHSRKQLQQKNLEQLAIDTEQIPSRLAQAQERLEELERQTTEKKRLEACELRYRKEQEEWQVEEAEMRSSCGEVCGGAGFLYGSQGTSGGRRCQGVLKAELKKRIQEKENERKRLSENLRRVSGGLRETRTVPYSRPEAGIPVWRRL